MRRRHARHADVVRLRARERHALVSVTTDITVGGLGRRRPHAHGADVLVALCSCISLLAAPTPAGERRLTFIISRLDGTPAHARRGTTSIADTLCQQLFCRPLAHRGTTQVDIVNLLALLPPAHAHRGTTLENHGRNLTHRLQGRWKFSSPSRCPRRQRRRPRRDTALKASRRASSTTTA